MANAPLDPESVGIIIEILQAGLLRIRSAGQLGDATLCAIEADHIHNLPQLLANGSSDLLNFYWKVERNSYLRELSRYTADGDSRPKIHEFEALWAILERYVS